MRKCIAILSSISVFITLQVQSVGESYLEQQQRIGKPVGQQVGLTTKDSTAGVLKIAQAPKDAPNVIVVLLDDVGFAATSTFGGLVDTPYLDKLANQGLRFSRFHTTGICSPTRAALLTGRNSHQVGMGILADMPMAYEGYTAVIPDSAATVADILQDNGYSTAAFGKWHLSPPWERSAAGPFDHWPTRMGFDYYYGFLGGETDQYEPDLYLGTTPVSRPDKENYHVTEDLIEKSIAWMQRQQASNPDKPFFVYLAPGATHAPLQAPSRWIEPYKGKFNQGWDVIRHQVLAQQKRVGVVPLNTQLAARPKQIPAWNSLSDQQKVFAARLMEVYAGFMSHTDAQVGNLVNALKQMDAFDNTLFIYVIGDNGASAEAGPLGTRNVMASYNSLPFGSAPTQAELASLGDANSHPNYPAGWAWATDTPFQWTKQVASHLGATRNGLVVSWPKEIKKVGGIRSQFHHVNDVLPTILDAVNIQAPAEFEGVAQQRMDGVSMLYAFDENNKEERRRTQYFDISGHRAIYHQGWMASAFHGRVPWEMAPRSAPKISEDKWELYNLDEDFSQSKNVAEQYPEKLAELKKLFWLEAGRNNVAPIEYRFTNRPTNYPVGGRDMRNEVSVFGAIERLPLPRGLLLNNSYTIELAITVPENGGRGVLVAEGGHNGGWSLFLDAQGKLAYYYNFYEIEKLELISENKVPAGKHHIVLNFDYEGKPKDWAAAGKHHIVLNFDYEGKPKDWAAAGKAATVDATVDGKQLFKGRIAQTFPYLISVSEPFDIGTDSLSPVGQYGSNYRFNGEIGKVKIKPDSIASLDTP